MKLRCIETECETRMFSEGSLYKATPYNGPLVSVVDDLGHSRYIGVRNGERIDFVIGHKPVDFTRHEIPQYAIFELES